MESFMATDPLSPKVLASGPNEIEAAAIVAAMAQHDIPARGIGGYTSGFKVGVASGVSVVVGEADVTRAENVLAEIQRERAEIDWSTEAGSQGKEIVNQLRSQSTWRLFFLGVITLGIYTAHYIKRQTAIINQYLDKAKQISEGFVSVILIFAYVAVILMIAYVFVEAGHPIEPISDSLHGVWVLLVLIWALKTRNRMNMMLNASQGGPCWFDGVATFLFPVLYFNFKINEISEGLAEQGAVAERLEIVCEECRKSTFFPAAKKGTVQECLHCGAYVDVE
jgi:hypothetical protein